jgi:hypothetical protein
MKNYTAMKEEAGGSGLVYGFTVAVMVLKTVVREGSEMKQFEAMMIFVVTNMDKESNSCAYMNVHRRGERDHVHVKIIFHSKCVFHYQREI